MNKILVDNKLLLQVVILGLIEDDGMSVHEVIKLLNMTAIAVHQGLRQERIDGESA